MTICNLLYLNSPVHITQQTLSVSVTKSTQLISEWQPLDKNKAHTYNSVGRIYKFLILQPVGYTENLGFKR